MPIARWKRGRRILFAFAVVLVSVGAGTFMADYIVYEWRAAQFRKTVHEAREAFEGRGVAVDNNVHDHQRQESPDEVETRRGK